MSVAADNCSLLFLAAVIFDGQLKAVENKNPYFWRRYLAAEKLENCQNQCTFGGIR
jgi:hypothetical protein